MISFIIIAALSYKASLKSSPEYIWISKLSVASYKRFKRNVWS